nr:hypothetical protein [Tanacetum cinerariifolium]
MKRRLFKGRVKTFTEKSLDVDASKQGRNDDKIKELNLTDGANTEVLVEDKGSGEKGGSNADQTLIKLRSEKAKEKEVAFRDVKEPPRLTRSTTTIQPLPTNDPKDKEFDEIQARIDADHELAVRMTHEEQEKYTIKEMERLLAEYFKRRKKQLAVERAEAIRNKPPTRTQVRNMVITYLKHMGKYTHQQLKHKTFEELQKLYQKEQKWIDDFVPMDSEKEQKKSNKNQQRVMKKESADYEHEKQELRMWLTVVSDEEEIVDPEISSTKYPIVDWESQILGNVDTKNVYVYKIIKANWNTSYHKSLFRMLRNFDKQDLVDLHRLVMKRFKDNTLEEKRYPLIKEMLEKMLNWKLKAEAKSTMAFKLLKFIKSQFRGGLLGIEDVFNLILLIMVSIADEDM